MGFITSDRNQLNLLGYSLDDFVPPDAKCRFVARVVSELDLSKLYDDYSIQGNDAFEPSIMLATWFYAYAEGNTSTRKLEQCCKRDLHYIYISANLHPDHSSLSRFRKRHLDLLPDYFIQIIKLAVEKGLSDFRILSIDGSKIQAASSVKQSKDSDALERHLRAVQKNIQRYLEMCDLDDSDGLADEDASEENLPGLKKKLRQLRSVERQLIERRKQLKQRQKQLKTQNRPKHRINLIEPDAMMMDRVNGYQKLPGYNAQVGVDSHTHLIVSNDVVQDNNDKKQFAKQHQKIKSNLGANPKRQFVCDSGYHSLEQLEYIVKKDIDAYIVDPASWHRASSRKTNSNPQKILQSKSRFERCDFIYHADEDYYECPVGEKLLFKRNYRHGKWKGRLYQAQHCRQCFYQTQCLSPNNKSGFKNLTREYRENLAEGMRHKLSTEVAHERLVIRRSTVEPVLGNLKANLGFRRFRLRGLSNVGAEFNLMCIAHNLNRLYNLFHVHCLFCCDYYNRTKQFVKERFNKLMCVNLRKPLFQIALLITFCNSLFRRNDIVG